MSRDYYKVLIVGGSGKGKTYAARHLSPKTTGFLNAEDKPLPFKSNFIVHDRPRTTKEVASSLRGMAENPQVEVIFFDSFSAYLDMLLAEARKDYKGYDIWNYYNEKVGKLLSYIKSIEKEVFVTAHYEMLLDQGEGVTEKRVKVKG